MEKELSAIAKKLEDFGCEGVALWTNTMHKVANFITDEVDIPFLHIANATSKKIKSENIDEVLLLGTRFTMQEDFYKNILEKDNISVKIPTNEECQKVDKIIFDELCLGKITPLSKQIYLDIIENSVKNYPNIKGVIFGCTEIGLLINQNDIDTRAFDTTSLHVKEIVDFMLS